VYILRCYRIIVLFIHRAQGPMLLVINFALEGNIHSERLSIYDCQEE
jgi:hypothetical protein